MQVSSHGHLPFNCLAPRLGLASGSAGAMLAPRSAPRLASPTGKRAGPIPSRPVGSRRAVAVAHGPNGLDDCDPWATGLVLQPLRQLLRLRVRPLLPGALLPCGLGICSCSSK